MKSSLYHRRRVLHCLTLPVITALASGLVGCATTPSPEKEREILLSRATAYWKRVVDNDLVAAFEYEEISKKPGWTLQSYLKREGILYEAVQVLQVRSLEGDRAIVDVKVTYSVPVLRMNSQEVVLQDEWVSLKGIWHHADRKRIL